MLRAQTVLRKTGARMLGGAVFCAVGAGSALCAPQRGRCRLWRECAFRKRRGAERHKGGGSAQSGGSVTGGGACFRRGSEAGERGAGGQKRRRESADAGRQAAGRILAEASIGKKALCSAEMELSCAAGGQPGSRALCRFAERP